MLADKKIDLAWECPDIAAIGLPFLGVVTELVYENNYGLLVTADGLEVYFLRSSVLDNRYGQLEPGSPVRFNLCCTVLGLQARQLALQDCGYISLSASDPLLTH